MTFLSRLFRAKPKVMTPEEQIAQLPQQTQLQLQQLLQSAAQEPVKDAALGLLDYGPELLNWAASHQTGRLQMAARKRLGQLLDAGQLSIKQLAQDVPKQIELVALASCSLKASLDLVEQIQSPTLLLELACNAPTTQIRQAAAQRLDAREDLEQLAKVAQNKDKAVLKIARNRLDAFKAQDAADAHYRGLLSGICDKVDALADKDADHLYKGKVLAYDNEWQRETQQAPVPEDLQQRFAQALGVCQAKIAARAEVIAKEEESIALDTQARQFVEAAVTDAKQLLVDLYNASHMDDLRKIDVPKKIQDLSQAVRLAAARNVPLSDQIQQFEQLKIRAQRLFEQLSQSGPVTDLIQSLQQAPSSEMGKKITRQLQEIVEDARAFNLEQVAPVLEQAKITVKSWGEKQKQLEQDGKQAAKDLADLARRGLWAAEQGFVRKARGIYKELQEKTQGLQQQVPAAISAKMADLDAMMNKWGDWHEFAVTPKKEQLIEQMQALHTSTLAPNDLASKIHDLQDQWRELSRGGQQADEHLWEQFQAASATAFAPCKDYFERQTQERETNLAQRDALLEQMHTYLQAYDWEHAVWKDVEHTLKVAREAWKTYWPVPRKAAKDQQERFDAVMDELHSKLKAHYNTNKTSKQKLIDEAAGLLDAADIAQAAEAIKQLQARWKLLGKSFPKDDQQLWLDFRAKCDAVFAKRQQIMDEANASREAVIATAKSYLQQMQHWIEQAPEHLAQARQQIDEVKNQFEGLGELPRKAAQELTAQYREYSEAIKKSLQQAMVSAKARSWDGVFAVAESLRKWELARLAGREADALSAQLDEQFAAIEHWPAGVFDVLTKRRALDMPALQEAQPHAETALLLLCIRAEILTQQETPEAFKAQRMAYQVEQLKQHFGRRDESLEQLTLEWLAQPAVSDEAYMSAWQRFSHCRSC
jgi:DNA repair protein SbcC/Rad50